MGYVSFGSILCRGPNPVLGVRWRSSCTFVETANQNSSSCTAYCTRRTFQTGIKTRPIGDIDSLRPSSEFMQLARYGKSGRELQNAHIYLIAFPSRWVSGWKLIWRIVICLPVWSCWNNADMHLPLFCGKHVEGLLGGSWAGLRHHLQAIGYGLTGEHSSVVELGTFCLLRNPGFTGWRLTLRERHIRSLLRADKVCTFPFFLL